MRARPWALFLKLIVRDYIEDGCQSAAAVLTWQTLFAIVPLFTIIYTLLSAFRALGGVSEALQRFLFENIVPETVAVLQEYLRDFSDQAKSLGALSLLLLLATAFLMVFTLEKSFNRIWGIGQPRRGFQRILMYWAILTLGPVMAGGGMAITTYVFSLPLISDVTGTPIFLRLAPVLLNTVFFTLMYVAIPNCAVPFRHGLIGGLVVAAAFELVRQVFGRAMAGAGFEVIYGAYAAVPLFLIWFYVCWTIVLFGAELTRNIGFYPSHRSTELAPPLIQILIILGEFFRCHRRGEVVTEKAVGLLGPRVDMRTWQDYKRRLLALGLIRPVDRGGLVLSKDLGEVTLWDLSRAFPWPLPADFRAVAGWEKTVQQKLSQTFEQGRESLSLDLERLFRDEP